LNKWQEGGSHFLIYINAWRIDVGNLCIVYQTSIFMKTKNLIAWVIAGLLALAFLMAGISKLTGQEELVQNFQKWGFSMTFMYFIGVCEIAGAAGLLLKKTWVYAAIGLALLMLGGIGTHIFNSEAFIPPLVLLLLTGTFLWLRNSEIPGLKSKSEKQPMQVS
jgi:putative oxidoreductase